jgi:enterochelin esterase family protein
MSASLRRRQLGQFLRRLAGDTSGVHVERLRGAGVRGLADRDVELWLPPRFKPGSATALFLMLDGQTASQWRLREAIEHLAASGQTAPVVVTVAASAERLDEYGTAGANDFAGRGKLAKLFQDFLVYEVLPEARRHCGLASDARRTGIFGASMGGLCAFDTAWRHPDVFGVAGVFSGSLWWRTDDSSPAAQQASRIAHRRVRESKVRSSLRLWFQAGTRDEASDRDGNGVIDAIQDTRELMTELAAKGWREGEDLVYREVEGGEHHEATWATVLPEFLQWAVRPMSSPNTAAGVTNPTAR